MTVHAERELDVFATEVGREAAYFLDEVATVEHEGAAGAEHGVHPAEREAHVEERTQVLEVLEVVHQGARDQSP